MDRSPTFFPAVRIFSLPKDGSAPGQNDDASAVNPAIGRFAVADGVSDSYDPGGWAQLLTSEFVEFPRDLRDIPALTTWVQGLGARFSDRPEATGQTWYQSSKAASGAAATFLGLEIAPPGADGSGGWTWLGVGDTCLFHLGDGVLLGVWPFSDPVNFGLTPSALRGTPWQSGADAAQRGHGTYRSGDWFLIATDALAQYLLRQAAAGTSPWHLWTDPSRERFRERVEALRASGQLRNDDTTLLLIQAGVPSSAARPSRPGIVVRNTEPAFAAQRQERKADLVADFIPADPAPFAPPPPTPPSPPARPTSIDWPEPAPAAFGADPRDERPRTGSVTGSSMGTGALGMAAVFPPGLRRRRRRQFAPLLMLLVAVVLLAGAGAGWAFLGGSGGDAPETPLAGAANASPAATPATLVGTPQPATPVENVIPGSPLSGSPSPATPCAAEAAVPDCASPVTGGS